MSYGLYVYEDDAGNEWSVSVPTDVAAALSMVAATGQPYVDETIAPRWANFKNASGQTRQAVVQSLSSFAGIVGTTITIGGTAFIGTSARGETIAAIQPPLIQPPQALMGPPGPATPLVNLSANQPSPLSLTTSFQEVCRLVAVPAGVWLITMSAYLEGDNGNDTQAYLLLQDPATTYIGQMGMFAANWNGTASTAPQIGSANSFVYAKANPTSDLILYAFNADGNWGTILPSAHGTSTNLNALKVG